MKQSLFPRPLRGTLLIIEGGPFQRARGSALSLAGAFQLFSYPPPLRKHSQPAGKYLVSVHFLDVTHSPVFVSLFVFRPQLLVSLSKLVNLSCWALLNKFSVMNVSFNKQITDFFKLLIIRYFWRSYNV